MTVIFFLGMILVFLSFLCLVIVLSLVPLHFDRKAVTVDGDQTWPSSDDNLRWLLEVINKDRQIGFVRPCRLEKKCVWLGWEWKWVIFIIYKTVPLSFSRYLQWHHSSWMILFFGLNEIKKIAFVKCQSSSNKRYIFNCSLFVPFR